MKPLSLEPSKSNTNATTRPLLTHVLPNLLNAAQYCLKVTAATRCAAEDSQKEPDFVHHSMSPRFLADCVTVEVMCSKPILHELDVAFTSCKHWPTFTNSFLNVLHTVARQFQKTLDSMLGTG